MVCSLQGGACRLKGTWRKCAFAIVHLCPVGNFMVIADRADLRSQAWKCSTCPRVSLSNTAFSVLSRSTRKRRSWILSLFVSVTASWTNRERIHERLFLVDLDRTEN